MTTLTANTITIRWPAQLLIAVKFTGHFLVALATVLFVGADHAKY